MATAGMHTTADDLTVRVGHNGPSIIQSISLDIAPGEILGLVGESGSGKTTLGLGLLWHAKRGSELTGGTVRHGGVDLGSSSRREVDSLRGTVLAYVPQDPSTALDPARRVGAQLRQALASYAARRNQEWESRAAALLQAVGLGDARRVLRSFPHQLSGGQLQRVALAIAFARDPKFVVLDEPTTGLDVVTQRMVIDLVRELCRSKDSSAVYITHDLSVVAELADSVAVMYGGNIVEYGSKSGVLSTPGHPYTRALLAARPNATLGARIRGIPGSPPRPGARPSGCPFAPRCTFHIPRCDDRLPDLTSVGPGAEPGHRARCIRLGELAPQVTPSAPLAGEPARIGGGPPADPPARRITAPILGVVDLSASYGHVEVLRSVDLTIPMGAMCALVGESGSGKTTLARCIAGLQTQWHGTLTLNGRALARAVRSRDRETAAAIQYVFQNPYASLNPRRSIAQIIEDPLTRLTLLKGAARRDRMHSAVDLAALPRSVLDRYPQELSGGERQRVALARAIAVKPQVLICDEVTSALDVSVQASVLETLRQLRRELQVAILYITHDLTVAASEADELVVLYRGVVVESGAARQVMRNPQADYTRTLLANMPRI